MNERISIHGFGPAGTNADGSFRIEADGPVCALHLRCGRHVHALQLSYTDAQDKENSTERAGVREGRLRTLRLKRGERITGITCFAHSALQAITVHTSLGRHIRFGDCGGAPAFRIGLSEGQELAGFYGRADARIEALGIIVAERVRPPEAPEAGFDFLPGLA